MYEQFYALRERPFQMTPDSHYLFWSENHTLAFTMLRYGLMTRAPITVVTGEIGAGKTTLLRKLLTEIESDIEIALISNMQPARGQLLHWIMTALGHPIDDETYLTLFRRFQEAVIAAYAAGRRVVLIFDEAQNLDVETLEELRMLSNINTDKDELLQIVLVGQPQLRDLLQSPALTQFNQRVCADFHLDALTEAEVFKYVEHRLAIAGASWRIFPAAACQKIYAATRGVPRLVNILCDLCLVYGYAADSKVINDELVHEFLSMARARGIYTQFASVDDQPKTMHLI